MSGMSFYVFVGLLVIAATGSVAKAEHRCTNTPTSPMEVLRDVATLEFQGVHDPDWLQAIHLRCPFSESAQVEDFIKGLCHDCTASISRAQDYSGQITHSKLETLTGSLTERVLSWAISSLRGSDWQMVNYELSTTPLESGIVLYSFQTRQLVRIWTSRS